ncbi:MAG: PAAR domain-containing protein [Candidatus Endolissoclinum sp.]|nr:PAAR domain-containing protein [Candidatus Endolissoclinum sp.]
MPQAARTTDPISPHVPCAPEQCGPGSDNVIIQGLPAYRVTDKTVPHGFVLCVPHVTPLVKGSHNVIVNNQPAGRVGDAHSCGVVVVSGSSKVIING